jgi:hypothetical protein
VVVIHDRVVGEKLVSDALRLLLGTNDLLMTILS